MHVRRILCPIDMSRTGDLALEFAKVIGRQFQATLDIVIVLPPHASDDSGAHDAGPTPTDVAVKQMRLAEVVGKSPDLQSRFHFLYGEPIEAIHEAIREWNPDVVVMGALGTTYDEGKGSGITGSVATEVAEHATCPVVIVSHRQVDTQLDPGAPSDTRTNDRDGPSS